MAVEKHKIGATVTLLSTELNSLATNTNALSSVGGSSGVFNNAQGQTLDGYVECDLELLVSFASAPAAGTGVAVWFLRSQDGTNFADGGASVTPARFPDQTFPLRPVTGAQRLIRPVLAPPGQWKVLARNDGTGQTTASSGNTLTIRVLTREGTAS